MSFLYTVPLNQPYQSFKISGNAKNKDTNLLVTGVGISLIIDGNNVYLSGSLDGDFATVENLFNTGDNLQTQINSINNETGNFLTSSDTGDFATAFNLFNSGQTLKALTDGNTSSIVTLIGEQQTLSTDINNLSGSLNISGADLEEQIGLRVLISNTGHLVSSGSLYNTGVLLWNRDTTLSGTFNTKLFQTGNILSGQINSIKNDTGNFVSRAQTGNFLIRETKSITIENPLDGDKIPLFRADRNLIPQSINSVINWTGSNPSVLFNLTQGNTRNGTAVSFYGPRVETNLTTGFNSSIFNYNTITGGNYVFLQIGTGINMGISGNLHVTLVI